MFKLYRFASLARVKYLEVQFLCRIFAVGIPKESFPRQRSRLDMVVNSNGVASASSPIGGKDRDCAPMGAYVRRRFGR